MSKKQRNKVLEDHGEWLLVDISTPKHPDATMAVDTDVFLAHEGGRIFTLLPPTSKYIYGVCKVSGKSKYLHRNVIDAGDLDVDHITHGSMIFVDNRRSNLRAVTNSQNRMNRNIRTDNTSGVVGVRWHNIGKKWQAQIDVNGERKYLGLFTNMEDAAGARQQAEREHYGEYAFNANNGEK